VETDCISVSHLEEGLAQPVDVKVTELRLVNFSISDFYVFFHMVKKHSTLIIRWLIGLCFDFTTSLFKVLLE
jgi:hypothetical protein